MMSWGCSQYGRIILNNLQCHSSHHHHRSFQNHLICAVKIIASIIFHSSFYYPNYVLFFLLLHVIMKIWASTGRGTKSIRDIFFLTEQCSCPQSRVQVGGTELLP